MLFLGAKQYTSDINSLTAKESTVSFSSDSYLRIKGESNVNTFECQFDMNTISDAVKIKYKDYNNKIKFDDTKLILPNLEFDCGGKAINKDFNELLNTEEFPQITLKLKEIAEVDINQSTVIATVEITISNIVRTYKVPVAVNRDNNLRVSGKMPLDINDFDLVAPTKMLGMIKVSPKIEIQFSLNIRS
ncbi:YceI family protein [Winogradskyella vidalii]|uniref:YceI family protein n=1 Tax=Winogradskyella vidalii TaxID=2615024 RepID=UPI0015C8292D|nr:YceI family protein [Winogradskyella vidalii]